jgi:hypothetical protein
MNVYMGHFEKLALDLVQQRQSLCIRYVDEILVAWAHGPEQLQNILATQTV